MSGFMSGFVSGRRSDGAGERRRLRSFELSAVRSDDGAIVVEATVALTAFMFAILTLLLIVDICIVQARIGAALVSAAKSISQYSYLYYKLNLDEMQSRSYEASAESRLTAEKTIDGVGSLMDSLSDAGTGLSAADFDGLSAAARDGAGTVKGLASMYKNELSDPRSFILGMAKLAGTELGEEGKNLLGRVLARSFTEKNLTASPSDAPERFLRRYRVADGLDGLDFTGTSLMAYGKSGDVRLVVSYDVTVIRLLDLDIKFRFTQRAETLAWGNGVSFKDGAEGSGAADGSKDSVWDWDNFTRGRYITNQEKKDFKYTGSVGFDGYDDTGGKNEFIQVASMYGSTYSTQAGVTGKLDDTLRNMRGIVAGYGETIAVKDSSGADVSVRSDPGTRTYKIVLVVPENADVDMIKSAAARFESERLAAGELVSVEVKAAYGEPSASG
ncbi:MAG: hypothetical protein LBD92_06470 [Oscillospiraceae bacterium]|nr:hypothetical protein [Oscillospiraceae bacterium]